MIKRLFATICIIACGVFGLQGQEEHCNGFETAAERGEWTLVNGTQTNKWVINTGANNGGQYGLYVSNNATAATPTNAYDNTASTVWAYFDWNFPACDEDFIFSFDWMCAGESSYDYMHVFVGRQTTTPTVGSTTAPTGSTQLTGPNSGRFNLQTSWQHFQTTLSSATYAGQAVRIFFMWRNDGSVNSAPPAAVDNVCIQQCSPCDQPVVVVTPTSATICQGESVNFSATVTGGAGNYTYQWSPAAGLSATNTPNVTATPTASTTYTLRVTDGADCAKTVRVPVEISGTTVSITQAPAVYCQGTDPITLNAVLNVNGSCNNYTYQWSTGATGAFITDTPQQNTTYTVTATPVGGNCCQLTATYSVTVNACNNECNGFESAGERGEWTLVNGTQTNKWVMGTGTNNGGQYSLYVSSNATSASPTNTYDISSTSNVWAYMDIEFPECDEDYVVSFDWRCQGESSFDYMLAYLGSPNITPAAGSNTAPAGAFQLQGPNGGRFNQQSSWQHFEATLPNATYSGQELRLFLLWHNDASGGTAPAIAVDNVCFLTCVPCDQPVVTVTPASLILCQGESAELTATATGGSGEGYTFEWSPVQTCEPATGQNVTVSPTQNTVYRLRVTDSEGCAKTVRVPAEIAGTTLTVTANPSGFCNTELQTSTIRAQLNVEGSCNSYTYQWSNGATGATISDAPTTTTLYTVTATPTDPNCCELIGRCVVAVMDCAADGCPSTTPLELGTGEENVYRDCNSETPEVVFYANAVVTPIEANDYFVFPIPNDPPFGYTEGNRIFVNVRDDTWNNPIDLPFTFCYYGHTYNQVVAGSNSVVSFDNSLNINSYCPYSYTESIPNTNLINNAIFACYSDIYPLTDDYVPATGDGGIFEGVLGEWPCRCYKLSFNNIKLFSCTDIRTFSTMIVLYEGTNIIDIYVRDAPNCPSWNGGRQLIGLQNIDGTQGITPPGRNTGAWTAHEEAWRFMPTGEAVYDITWYEGTDTSAATGVVLGHGDMLVVTPTQTTTYTSRLQYTSCNGDHIDVISNNNLTVTFNDEVPDVTITATENPICLGATTTIILETEGTGDITYLWSNGETTPRFDVTPEDTVTTYYVTVTFDNGCTYEDSITIYATVPVTPPVFTYDPEIAEICLGESCTITADPHFAYAWSNGSTEQSIRVRPQVTTNYTLTVTNEIGCSAEATAQVIVHPMPVASFAPGQYMTFLDEGEANVHFIDFSTNTFNWLWDFGDAYSSSNSSTDPSPDHIYTNSGIYTVSLFVTSDFGCADSTSQQVSIQKPFFFYVPSSFTPDGDGINDEWLPVGEGINLADYSCTVYDRNGRLLFHTTTPTQGWNGKDMNGKNVPLGSYVYIIQTSTLDFEPKEFIGTLTIVR